MNDFNTLESNSSSRQDQTQLDSMSESKKMSQSYAVQKVVIVACDCWFLIHIFVAKKLAPNK